MPQNLGLQVDFLCQNHPNPFEHFIEEYRFKRTQVPPRIYLCSIFEIVTEFEFLKAPLCTYCDLSSHDQNNLVISGHVFVNYIKICHKTEVPTVILRFWNCLNLHWLKSYDTKTKPGSVFLQVAWNWQKLMNIWNISFKKFMNISWSDFSTVTYYTSF